MGREPDSAREFADASRRRARASLDDLLAVRLGTMPQNVPDRAGRIQELKRRHALGVAALERVDGYIAQHLTRFKHARRGRGSTDAHEIRREIDRELVAVERQREQLAVGFLRQLEREQQEQERAARRAAEERAEAERWAEHERSERERLEHELHEERERAERLDHERRALQQQLAELVAATAPESEWGEIVQKYQDDVAGAANALQQMQRYNHELIERRRAALDPGNPSAEFVLTMELEDLNQKAKRYLQSAFDKRQREARS